MNKELENKEKENQCKTIQILIIKCKKKEIANMGIIQLFQKLYLVNAQIQLITNFITKFKSNYQYIVFHQIVMIITIFLFIHNNRSNIQINIINVINNLI